MTAPFDRRKMLGLMAGGAALTQIPAAAQAAKLETLALFGPPAGPSVSVSHAVGSGAFDTIADTATFAAWRTPDELRAGLTSGTMQLSVVPVQAAANLYNRGFPIRLANVMTNGLLYIISADDSISNFADLKGRKIAVPFRGDTPEIIFGQLLTHHGIDAANDVDLTYTGTPIEAMQMLLTGRADAALTAEPASTAGIFGGKTVGKTVRRVIDLQQAWGDMTGAAPVVPQAGLAVTAPFLEANGDLIPTILSALETATDQVLADPTKAANQATKSLKLPAPLLAASVPHCNLVARVAQDARADIERMLGTMSGDNMKRIGGKMPDDGFYL